MSMFYLEPDVAATDFECPACNMTFDVLWWTEYGEPINGKYDVECPACGYEFDMVVSTCLTYTPRLKEPKDADTRR